MTDLVAWLEAFLDMPQRLKRMEKIMAADRDLLAKVAEGLVALGPSVAALIASEAALRAQVAELQGAAATDEAGDLSAAQDVKDAFDPLAAMFTAEPGLPDVPPVDVPPVEDPADPAGPTDPTQG